MTKPTKWLRPAKPQRSLGIRPVWSESSLCAQWEAKDPSFLPVDSEDWSDWADTQADLSHSWAHMPFHWFCHEMAQVVAKIKTFNVMISCDKNLAKLLLQWTRVASAKQENCYKIHRFTTNFGIWRLKIVNMALNYYNNNSELSDWLINLYLPSGPILINWTSPLPILGVSPVLFHFYYISNIYSCYKQWRPWSDATFCGVWSGSALFAYVPKMGR